MLIFDVFELNYDITPFHVHSLLQVIAGCEYQALANVVVFWMRIVVGNYVVWMVR